MGKPLDPDYWKKYRASHPEYAARDRARCRARKARTPRGDRSAEYAKRNAARSSATTTYEPLAPLYPELQHGTAVAFWEDELRMDLAQERWLARLEGRDGGRSRDRLPPPREGVAVEDVPDHRRSGTRRMIDYHAIQMTGSKCQGKNCACASAAMAIYFGTRAAAVMTADDVRAFSHISCTPGVDTPSGGITISAVERVCAAKGVTIDFGRASTSFYRRWNSTEVLARLSTYYGGQLLGLYSSVKAPWRAHGSTFQGGHSVWAHDLRDDLPDSHFDKVQRTACWHDPLRPRPIRVPMSVVIAYTQTASPLKGFAGWVKIPALPGGTYAQPMTDRTRLAYATLGVHSARTTGAASTKRVIRGKGKLVEIAMYATGEPYGKGPNRNRWGALSLLGNEWVHLNRLEHTGGTT